MNQVEIAAVMKGIAPVLRDAITTAMQPLVYRLIALESREPAQGEPGTDGRDGKDADPEDIVRAVTVEVEKAVGALPAPKDGVDGQAGADAYPGEARGLYDAAAEYRARDVVAHNSSAWMAKRDEPGELPGDGWMLLAGRGKRGEAGERGERGVEGKAGKDGAQPVALKLDEEKMQFVMVLDSGEVLEADFAPVMRAVVEATRDG